MKQVCLLLVLSCIMLHASAQISLRGTVTDTDGLPLTGAHVWIQNSYFQTTTDEAGNYVLTGIKSGSSLMKVSYVGYEPYESLLKLRRDTAVNITLNESATISEAVIVSAIRASQNTPTTFKTLNKEDISRNNLGQDLPYMLSHEPSVVATSDAGGGVGYTGMRIRGSDITRINVTINGIPLNDPESHVVYWVDVPDIASSVNSLQLQRGVGSSTNGAGAFGASMNLETNTIQKIPYATLNLGAGSFNTWKTSFQAGTGLINDHWFFEGRGSTIKSDGYIDRASSDLKSYYFQGGYTDSKTLIKALAFGGTERTYQAWWGIDEYTMNIDRTFNWAGAIQKEDGSYDFYKDQVDQYSQNHFQLHVSRKISQTLSLNVSGHYTKGKGYYEEYQQSDDFSDYGISPLYLGKDSILNEGVYDIIYHDTITSSDLVRRRWLDNHYYGITWSLRYLTRKLDLVFGGAINKFDKAKHYGEVIWAQYALETPNDYRYYDNTGFKTDFNVFTKAAWTPVEDLTFYGDIQYRTIRYKNGGLGSDLNLLDIDEAFDFFNPKVGISYNLNLGNIYISYGIAHREPIRDDYTDAPDGEKPKPETLGNLEMGIRKSHPNYQYHVNYFLMNYRNQLVLTGAINDDGVFIRKNAGKSYRMGFEISAGYKPIRLLEVSGNLSLSLNKTDFSQEVNSEIITYKNTAISFSPSLVSGTQVRIFPVKNMELEWRTKYVGKQYLDNTENEALSLDPYFLNDARFSYLWSQEKMPAVEFTLLVQNLFNVEYESNGSVYDGSPYYYPQAGINFMAGIAVKF